jgi:hypothetical protein
MSLANTVLNIITTMIQDNCYMWTHIFNINIVVIFEFFFKNFRYWKLPDRKRSDIGNYRTKEDNQSYLDFVGHQPTRVQIEEMKEDFANSSGQLLDMDNCECWILEYMVWLLICLIINFSIFCSGWGGGLTLFFYFVDTVLFL